MDNWDSFKKVADKFNIESLVGKEYTWKLERFHLTIRTALSRFVRRGIRYSKSSERHLKVY
jgi:IS1 family transposase